MENIKYYFYIFLLRAVAWLPLRCLYAVSDLMYLIFYKVVRYRRKMVRRNLINSFPEKTAADIEAMEKGFYHHLCDLLVETIKLLHISDEEMLRRVDVRNASLIEQAAAEKRPVFLFIGHLGNWEWVQEVTKRISQPAIRGEIYHPMHSHVFERIMIRMRSRYDTKLIKQKNAVRTIIKMKREADSYLIGFIADQRPTRHNLNHWMQFMHQDTPYMVGGEEIGRHIDAKYLFLHVSKPRRGHYVMTVRDITIPTDRQFTKNEYPYVKQYMRMLEENIKESPEIYLWSHNRWKHKRNNQQQNK